MKAYKYQIFDKNKSKYAEVNERLIFFNLEEATKAVTVLTRGFYPSDPNDFYEIHQIAICDVCIIEP